VALSLGPRFPGHRTAKATQRMGAGTLLLAFLLPLLACIIGTGPTEELSLPACCRTHGKHHCMASEDLTHGTHVRATGSHCPFCPGALPSMQHQTLSLLRVPRLFTASATHALLPSRSESHARTRHRDVTQTRGPPVLFLS